MYGVKYPSLLAAQAARKSAPVQVSNRSTGGKAPRRVPPTVSELTLACKTRSEQMFSSIHSA